MDAISSSGHLVYLRGGALMAVQFDPDTLRTSGTAVRVLDAGMLDTTSGAASVAVSSGGTIAYVPGGPRPLDTMALAWVDRQGAHRLRSAMTIASSRIQACRPTAHVWL